MFASMSIRRSLLAVCGLLSLTSHALELEAVRPHEFSGNGHRVGKRDNAALDFRNYQSLLWEAPDGADLVLGNFTIHTPGTSEHVLSMETFDDMIKSVKCEADSLTLQFIDDETFAYAQKVWDWVNGEDDHKFLMVTSNGACGNGKYRAPYLVSKLKYNEVSNTAYLTAKTGEWKDLVHAYELHVGKVPMPPARRSLQIRKDGDDAKAFSIAKPFPFVVKVESGPFKGELECSDCGLDGQLNVEMHVKFGLPDIIDKATFRIAPQGVRARANPKLTIGAESKIPHVWDQKLFPQPIPLYAITLGGFMKLGVFNDLKGGIEFTKVEGTVTFQAGAVATIPDSAFVEVDFKNLGDGIDSSSWAPSMSYSPLQVTGKIAAGLQLFVMPELKLEASALNFGYEAALELKAPYWDIKAELTKDESGNVCDNPQTTLGLGVTSSFGVEVAFGAGQINKKHDVEVAIATLPLKEIKPLCIPLQSKGDKSPTTGNPSNGPTSNPSLPAPTSSSGATTCKNNAGVSGTCISTSSCSSNGGKSEAGHCPGASNIQCCTNPTGSGSSETGSGDTCTANGKTGTCMSTSSCPSSSAVSVPGHCAGPTDIQCCVSKPSDPPADSTTNPSTCKNNAGVSGTCVAVGSCRANGGVSEAGHCSGAASIQCCTYPKSSGDTCSANGKTGTCMPTASCPSDTAVSVAGHCSGPTDVQCCVEKPPASSTPGNGDGSNLCTIDKAGLANSGFVGECISTSACKSGGGTSTKGFCAGGADTQCCTYGTCKNDVAGTCEPEESCTGKTSTGLCPGGKNIKCCQHDFVANHPGQQ